MGGHALKKTLSCLQRRPLLCPSASHQTHKTDAQAHEGHDARRRSSARAETVTQRSGRSRCDTLTAARCEERGGKGAQPGLFLKPPSMSSARSARTQHHSMHGLRWRAGGKKTQKTSSVDDREQWIFEKWRCDKRDGLSAMKHLACKRRSAGFYTLRCRFIPTASCLHRRTVGCVQTIKRLSLNTPECHTWPHRFGVDDWGRQRDNAASDSTSYTAGASPLLPSFS